MNLNELQELYHEADLIISLKIDSLLQEEYKTLGEKSAASWSWRTLCS
jgi:hypothetical protein